MLKKGSRRRAAFTLLLVVWLVKFTLGLIAATNGDAPSYPDAARGFPHPYMGDLSFYVMLPAALSAMNLLLLALASRIPVFAAIAIAALQVLFLLFLTFLGTGGI